MLRRRPGILRRNSNCRSRLKICPRQGMRNHAHGVSPRPGGRFERLSGRLRRQFRGRISSGDDGTPIVTSECSPSGQWTARISSYGHISWMQWRARANREFTVEATALDESGQPTVNKAQLVLGMWNGTDAEGIPPVTGTPQPFNGNVVALTTLPLLTTADSEVRLGIADLRGDGRPDYLYRGRVLYADTVVPPRLPATGGPIVIDGIGFRQNKGRGLD